MSLLWAGPCENPARRSVLPGCWWTAHTTSFFRHSVYENLFQFNVHCPHTPCLIRRPWRLYSLYKRCIKDISGVRTEKQQTPAVSMISAQIKLSEIIFKRQICSSFAGLILKPVLTVASLINHSSAELFSHRGELPMAQICRTRLRLYRKQINGGSSSADADQAGPNITGTTKMNFRAVSELFIQLFNPLRLTWPCRSVFSSMRAQVSVWTASERGKLPVSIIKSAVFSPEQTKLCFNFQSKSKCKTSMCQTYY